MVTDATKLLLLWFEQDELDDCPDCGQKHLLPDWGSPHGRSCASCGFIGNGSNGSRPPAPERVESREHEFIQPG
jgi:hypothetical protein